MNKSIAKKRPGRPATGRDQTVATRLPKNLIKSLDMWAKTEGMTRGEAMRWIITEYFKKTAATELIQKIRWIVELALKKGKPAQFFIPENLAVRGETSGKPSHGATQNWMRIGIIQTTREHK